MSTKNESGLHITEGIGGVWFYHLSESNTNARALCGANTMSTSIPLTSWGVRGHMKEGWCSDCEMKGFESLHAVGAALRITEPSPQSPSEFCANESIPASVPPVERGVYAVLREKGVTQVAAWDGKCWGGLSDVVSYSGIPSLLTAAQREQCRQNIRAGVEVQDGHDERILAKLSALRLARHRAVTMSKAISDEEQLLHIREMVGHFMVARTLGVSFLNGTAAESNPTDQALFAWGIAQIRAREPQWFELIGSGIETDEGIRDWLDNR